jgi:dTDP-4-dehydrorhamnose 3,5-epimerase
MIKDVVVTPLDLIDTPGGMVMHAMKDTSTGFAGFGEAYFSQIYNGSIKAWKRHKEMTLNLVVPIGEIKFVLFDDRNGLKQFQEIVISKSNYCRLTIPPMIWVGFQGLYDDASTILNIANIEHNPKEVDRLKLDKINYDWGLNL